MGIEWNSYSAPSGTGQAAFVNVPVEYNSPGSTLTIYVRTYKNEKTSRLVYLIVGGPGQDAALWEPQLPALWNVFGGDTTFIIIDHRGVGKSSPLTSPNDMSWQNNWTAFNSTTKYPITALTISNAGRDIVQIAKLLQEEYPGIPHVLVGSSYGTRVAVAAANAAPDMFQAALLDGLDMENANSSLATVTGEELLENCARNQYCNRAVGGDPRVLPALIPRLAPSLNACTASFFGKMEALLPGLEPSDVVDAVFYKLMISSSGRSTADRRQLPAMWIVALLAQFKNCTDTNIVGSISDQIAKLLHSSFSFASTAQIHNPAGAPLNGIRYSTLNPSALSISLAGGEEPSNMLVHAYISASERWRGTAPSYCATCAPQIFKICTARALYVSFGEIFGQSLYQPDGQSQSAMSGKTRVIVLAGGLDYNTPLKTAETMVGMMRTPYKHIVKFANRGHNLLQDSECIRAAVDELLERGSASKTDSCVDALNRVTLDWEGQDDPLMRGLFTELPTSAEISANRSVSEAGSGVGIGLILLSIGVVFGIAGGIGLFVWRKRRSAIIKS
jgi:pimeloyl-ACP methyl ester carboxylesterase